MKLSHWAQMAKMHWEKHLPNYYRKLQSDGTLYQECQKAGDKAQEMMGELAEQGLRRNEVLEIVLPQFILLPPENLSQF